MLTTNRALSFAARSGGFFLTLLLWSHAPSNLAAATYSVLNTNDSGAGSFRQAINDANTNAGSHTIAFQIPGPGPFSIQPASPLPGISNVVVIDATTQTNYAGSPRVELNGSNAGGGWVPGLWLQSSNGTVRGLAINRFSGDGIRIEGAGGNTLQANFIGTDISGTGAAGNGNTTNAGVTVLSAGNLIGGTNAAARNVISGNGGRGLIIAGLAASNNFVAGNYIGTSATGLAAISNAFNGVDLFNTSGNTVGGTAAGAGNLISGNNGLAGMMISAASGTGNIVQNNLIGTDATGTNALPNAQSGVIISGVAGNQIGPSNVISGNGVNGLLISSNAPANSVRGNFIGTDKTGLRRLGNTQNGVRIESPGNTIGGLTTAAGNIISGNTYYGIYIYGGAASNNLIQGNFIGTDVTGTAAISNTFAGIGIVSAPANTIGGTTPAAHNLISGNIAQGIYITGSSAAGNLVQGNYIGTDINGTNAIRNADAGIRIENAPSNTVGGAAAAARNLISGNNLQGIYIISPSATGNLIQGNYIGTDITGNSAIANGIGLRIENGAGGIDISAAPANTIGGTASGSGNLISGNWRDAIAIGDLGASNNIIQGNFIGVKADGVSPLGNEWSGVEIRTSGGGGGTIIGGNTPGVANVIAFAGATGLPDRDGVRIRTGSGNVGILIRGNKIFSNGWGVQGLGIDLGLVNGVDPNVGCNTGTSGGANMLQNYPVLTNILTSGGLTFIQGTLNSTPNSTYQLDFYANTVVSASGYGEGQYYLGYTNVTTDNNCNGSFTFVLPAASVPGQYISATATDAGNNTSEFCTNAVVNSPTISVQPQSQNAIPGSNVTFSVTAAGSGTLVYQWRTNGTAKSGATNASLALTSVTTNDALNYDVVITNSYGALTSAVATLTVGLPPTITQPLQNQTNVAGTTATFTVSVTGTAPFSYQWRTNGTAKSGATNASLTLNNISTNDALFNYDVVVTNLSGAATSTVATLTVLLPPTIAQSPQSQTNILGNAATFTVTAAGTPPFNYQWRTNGTAKSGATNASLTLNNITTNDALFNYDVVVTNAYGSATSAVATLTVVNYAPTLTPLFVNGSASNRINIVLLSEGYRTNELSQFLVDAANVAGHLLASPPYNEYSNYFNAYAVSVASADSGSDHYTPAVSLKNTYFNSSYDSSGIDRLITIPPNDRDANAANGTGKIQTLLTNAALFPNQPWAATLLPQINAANRFVVLVVNDTAYGGSGQPPDAGNPLPIAITSLGSSGGFPALDIIVHESAHTLANLADEYTNAFPSLSPVERANATAQTNLNSIPWKAWITNGVPLPTPDTGGNAGVVGLFAGAEYQTAGWYRARHDCKMNHFGVPFCEICSEAIVLAINQKVRTIDAFTPATNSLTLTGPQAVAFTATRLQPGTHNLNLQWFTNGIAVAGATGATFNFAPGNFTNGAYAVQARITDATALVRTDPLNNLSNSVSWNVTVALTSLQLLSSHWLDNGQFTFAVTGAAPFGFVIEASTNLANWSPVATNSLVNGVFNFTNTPGFPQRYYRTIVNP